MMKTPYTCTVGLHSAAQEVRLGKSGEVNRNGKDYTAVIQTQEDKKHSLPGMLSLVCPAFVSVCKAE